MESAILRVPPPAFLDEMPTMVSQDNAQLITGRSKRTVQRWIRRGRISDPAALRLLQTACYGLLLADGWEGWRISRRRLVGPHGETVTPGEIRADFLTRQVLAQLRQRCSQLEAENEKLRSQIRGPLFRILEA